MERVVKVGGSEQIRTAVEAFAELCLATRPQNRLYQKLSFNMEEKMVTVF